MLKSMVLSRSIVCVIEAADRSTLPLTRSGMRVGEVTFTNSTGTTMCLAKPRTKSRSKPTGSFFSSRKPKGGVSNLTPAISLPRDLIAASVSWVCACAGAPAASTAASARAAAVASERRLSTGILLCLSLCGWAEAGLGDARERLVEIGIGKAERKPQVAGAGGAEGRPGQGGDVDGVEPVFGDGGVVGRDFREQIESGVRHRASDAVHFRQCLRRAFEAGTEGGAIARRQRVVEREGGDAGRLDEGRHAIDRVLEEFHQRLGGARRRREIAEPPAGHAEGLRKAVDDEGAGAARLAALCEGNRLVVAQVGIDLIEDHPQIVLLRELDDGGEFFRGQDAAGRVDRRVDDDGVRRW